MSYSGLERRAEFREGLGSFLDESERFGVERVGILPLVVVGDK